jgi:hypothetical protein
VVVVVVVGNGPKLAKQLRVRGKKKEKKVNGMSSRIQPLTLASKAKSEQETLTTSDIDTA